MRRDQGASSAIIHRRLAWRLGTGLMPRNFIGNSNPTIMCGVSRRLLFSDARGVGRFPAYCDHTRDHTHRRCMVTEQPSIYEAVVITGSHSSCPLLGQKHHKDVSTKFRLLCSSCSLTLQRQLVQAACVRSVQRHTCLTHHF